MDFTGKPLRGFVYVSPPGFRTGAALRTWVSRGERVAKEKATEPTKRRQSGTTSSAAGNGRAKSKGRRSSANRNTMMRIYLACTVRGDRGGVRAGRAVCERLQQQGHTSPLG